LSDPTNAGTEDPGEQQRPAPPVRARTVRVLSAVLAVVLVVAAGAAVWLWLKTQTVDDEQKERAAASNVATQLALRVDTFDGTDIDEYSKSIQALLTTKYKAEFEEQFEPFKQLFTQAKATGTGKIIMSGVGSADSDSATVLVVHDAMVKSQLGDQQRHLRWTVDLVKVDGRWLVDDFNPVN